MIWRGIRVFMFIFAFFASIAWGKYEEASEFVQPFRIGFSSSLFSNVNGTDVKAAIKVWAAMVAKEHAIHMDPIAQIYDRLDLMVAGVKAGEVDSINLVFKEYIAMSKEVELDRWFVTRSAGELVEKYVLLVARNAGVDTVEDLKARTLVVHHGARTSLVADWLDWLVIQRSDAANAHEFFGKIRLSDRVSGTVLPVFFGQADAAAVAESSFKTMCELNPQLRKTIRILAISRPLVPAVMCFRKSFKSAQEELLLKALGELNTTPAGEQVLTIFKCEALVQVGEKPILETAEFCAEVERLRRKCFEDHPVEEDFE